MRSLKSRIIPIYTTRIQVLGVMKLKYFYIIIYLQVFGTCFKTIDYSVLTKFKPKIKPSNLNELIIKYSLIKYNTYMTDAVILHRLLKCDFGYDSQIM